MKITGFSRVEVRPLVAEVATDLICPGCDADLTQPNSLSLSVLGIDDAFRPGGHFERRGHGARVVHDEPDLAGEPIVSAGCSTCGEPDFDLNPT